MVFFVVQGVNLNLNSEAQNINWQNEEIKQIHKQEIGDHTTHDSRMLLRMQEIRNQIKKTSYHKNKHLYIRESTTKRACHLFSSCFFFHFPVLYTFPFFCPSCQRNCFDVTWMRVVNLQESNLSSKLNLNRNLLRWCCILCIYWNCYLIWQQTSLDMLIRFLSSSVHVHLGFADISDLFGNLTRRLMMRLSPVLYVFVSKVCWHVMSVISSKTREAIWL